MISALALLLIAVFALALRLLRLGQTTRLAWRECLDTGLVLRSGASDLEKERAARRAALSLSRLFLVILLRIALALAAPLALTGMLVALGVASWSELERALLSAPVLVAGAVLTFAAALIR